MLDTAWVTETQDQQIINLNHSNVYENKVVRSWNSSCLGSILSSVLDTTSSGRHIGWKDVSPGSRGITKTSAQVLAADTMTSPVLSKKKT